MFNVSIDARGALAVNGSPVPDAAHVTAAASAAAKATPEVRAYIFADKSVPYGRVIEVMDAIRTGGISKIAFAVDPARKPVTTAPLGR
jgi:biopolymer transport protein ExbD